ncbi:hypothetical protein HR11_03785 [Porphyromonas macacae]|nr:hypothetical protein HR11_03785 [Porphyromonas macacae]
MSHFYDETKKTTKPQKNRRKCDNQNKGILFFKEKMNYSIPLQSHIDRLCSFIYDGWYSFYLAYNKNISGNG